MDRSELLSLRLQGWTYASIAAVAGVSRQRIQAILSPPRAVRNAVVNASDGRCRSCLIFVGDSGHVHHIGQELETEESYNDLRNLVLLCPSCHKQAHVDVMKPEPPAVFKHGRRAKP